MIGCVTGEPTLTELDDVEALDRIYRARLLRFVAYSTGDQDLAETIVQDCLLKAYNGRGSFLRRTAASTPGSPTSQPTWSATIKRSRKFQFWRRVHKNVAPDLNELSALLPGRGSSPESQMLAREKAQQVTAALETLSVNQRTIFLMRFIEEMDLQEICQATGMQMSTVKTHLHRAVKAVRLKIGGAV